MAAAAAAAVGWAAAAVARRCACVGGGAVGGAGRGAVAAGATRAAYSSVAGQATGALVAASRLQAPAALGGCRTVLWQVRRAASGTPAAAAAPAPAPAPAPAATPGGDGDLGSFVITPAAVARLQQVAAKRAAPVHLRVAVDSGGCSGLKYTLTIEAGVGGGAPSAAGEEADVVVERDGARIVADPASMGMLRGATIDFTTEMARQGFAVLNNPHASGCCGCGSSFNPK